MDKDKTINQIKVIIFNGKNSVNYENTLSNILDHIKSNCKALLTFRAGLNNNETLSELLNRIYKYKSSPYINKLIQQESTHTMKNNNKDVKDDVTFKSIFSDIKHLTNSTYNDVRENVTSITKEDVKKFSENTTNFVTSNIETILQNVKNFKGK